MKKAQGRPARKFKLDQERKELQRGQVSFQTIKQMHTSGKIESHAPCQSEIARKHWRGSLNLTHPFHASQIG